MFHLHKERPTSHRLGSMEERLRLTAWQPRTSRPAPGTLLLSKNGYEGVRTRVTKKPRVECGGSLVEHPLAAVPISSVHQRKRHGLSNACRASAVDALPFICPASREQCFLARSFSHLFSHPYLADTTDTVRVPPWLPRQTSHPNSICM